MTENSLVRWNVLFQLQAEFAVLKVIKSSPHSQGNTGTFSDGQQILVSAAMFHGTTDGNSRFDWGYAQMVEAGATFDYLLGKIAEADILTCPFAHIEISDFLAKEHFEEIVNERQIALDSFSDTEELFDSLEANSYEIIPFPGTVIDKREYLDWLHGVSDQSIHDATEGFGVVCRLTQYDNPILKELNDFFTSERLKGLIVEKFDIQEDVYIDAGIQKYLHGYEISPHPDIRRKAATWMLNLNPGDESEDLDFHTHYLKLKDQWRFIGEFWRYNQDVDRCWLPWDWCETVKQQTRNNSIVLFSPADDTIHAVKANYDHLKTQRTQAYGNLWYYGSTMKRPEFQDFDLKSAL